jgi:hypothetical protein
MAITTYQIAITVFADSVPMPLLFLAAAYMHAVASVCQRNDISQL